MTTEEMAGIIALAWGASCESQPDKYLKAAEAIQAKLAEESQAMLKAPADSELLKRARNCVAFAKEFGNPSSSIPLIELLITEIERLSMMAEAERMLPTGEFSFLRQPKTPERENR